MKFCTFCFCVLTGGGGAREAPCFGREGPTGVIKVFSFPPRAPRVTQSTTDGEQDKQSRA